MNLRMISMTRLVLPAALASLAVALVLLAGGCGAVHTTPVPTAIPTARPSPTPTKQPKPQGPCHQACIKHVVIIIRENHSFDNLFGRYHGANGATHAWIDGAWRALYQTPDRLQSDLGHGGLYGLNSVDHGRMDGFSLEHNALQGTMNVAYSQYSPRQMGDYWAYARHFGLADNFFSTVLGPSFPNHLVFVAGQAANAIDNVKRLGPPDAWGCDSNKRARVRTFANGRYGQVFPCFSIGNLASEANAVHVGWRYYADPIHQAGYVWSSFDAIRQIRYSQQWKTNVAHPRTFIPSVLHGRLAPVTWLTSGLQWSEHPPQSECLGENWTVEQINAVMRSRFWRNTAVIVTWDDFGGFYDHVPPPSILGNPFQLGIRVPTLLISPYTRPGLVSHVQFDFRSVVKYVEQTFHLPHTATYDRSVHSIRSMINFREKPLRPLPLQTQRCRRQGLVSPAATRQSTW